MSKESFLSLGKNTIGMSLRQVNLLCISLTTEALLGVKDVMNQAGHADFNTAHRFYLSMRDDLLQRARAASAEAMNT